MTRLLFALVVLIDRGEESGLRFDNVFGGPEKRFIYETLGSGAALFDYDMDGDLDIYLVNGAASLSSPGPPNRLFRNDGGGRFRDETEQSGSGDTGFGVAAAVADVDADGDPDLFVANNGADVLYLNRGDGTFARRSLPDELMAGSAVFGDYDFDGLPDLYVSSYVDESAFRDGGKGTELCNWKGLSVGCGPTGLPAASDRLYRNEDGRLDPLWSAEPSYGLGVLFQDLNGDGRPDIYVANDSEPNFLFVNLPDGTFSEEGLMRGAAYSGEGLAQAGMGVDAGDIDSDGDMDLVVTNFSDDHTTLYENLGKGFFADASFKRGIGVPTYFPLSWGARFADLDADGDLDLFIAHGHIYPQLEAYAAPNQLFLNDGTGRFVLAEGAWERRSSRGVSSGDYDNDGRIDLLVTSIDGPPELLHNETDDSGSSVLVQLVGTRSGREGLGATITVETARRKQRREATSGGGYAGASDPRLHFGLDEEDVVAIDVHWPSGSHDRIEAPGASRLLVVKEGVGLIATSSLAARNAR